MPERRILCANCPSYDADARRCRIGKSNPRKKHEAISVAETLGARALCLHSPFREPLLLRMHAPDRRFVWGASTRRTTGPDIEIEILDDEDRAEPSDDV